MATVGAESKDKRIEVFYDSVFRNDACLLSIPGTSELKNIKMDVIYQVPVKHSDIDSVIEALQKYKKSITEVLGADALK